MIEIRDNHGKLVGYLWPNIDFRFVNAKQAKACDKKQGKADDNTFVKTIL